MKFKIIKIAFLFGLGLFFLNPIYAQQGIGTNQPNKSAALDVQAGNKGLLIPRVDLVSLDDFSPMIGNPTEANSLLVYHKGNETLEEGFYYWITNGSVGRWIRIVNQDDLEALDLGVEPIEPWQIQGTTDLATDNTQNIYQQGNVAIGKMNGIQEVSLDVFGSIRGGNPDLTADIGDNSLAVGEEVEASGNNSTAFGLQSKATGEGSFAAGEGVASGQNSFAFGPYSQAIGQDAIAIGRGAKAAALDQMVIGTFNKDGLSSTNIFQIGIGQSESNRRSGLVFNKDAQLSIGTENAPFEAQLEIGDADGTGKVKINRLPTFDGSPDDKLVVVDSDGFLKSVHHTQKSAMPKFFYMPSLALPLTEDQADPDNFELYNSGTGVFTINLHAIYHQQFNTPMVSNPGSNNALPALQSNELNYHITYYDTTVFEQVTLSDAGILTYKIKPDAEVTAVSFMNVVFEVKEN